MTAMAHRGIPGPPLSFELPSCRALFGFERVEAEAEAEEMEAERREAEEAEAMDIDAAEADEAEEREARDATRVAGAAVSVTWEGVSGHFFSSSARSPAQLKGRPRKKQGVMYSRTATKVL